MRFAKPFVKWAGGKSQLLPQVDARFPSELEYGSIDRYIEPFVGGGAVFFHVAQRYPVIEFHIADINPDLILTYRTIQQDVETLILVLAELEAEYLPLSQDSRKDFFYQVRSDFNTGVGKYDYAEYDPTWVARAAQFIFLNRTCFNGLFRVNSKGLFNVPVGRYKRPTICDAANLRAVARVLKTACIYLGDFESIQHLANDRSLVYFDPPYRPITATASFNSYAKGAFSDREQKRLAAFYRQLDSQGAKLVLSNSDPKNEHPEDDFFERLYAGYHIERVAAKRVINSNGSSRGEIYELLIMNYEDNP